LHSSARHPPRICVPGARSSLDTVIVMSESLHPRPRVTNCQGAGASTQVDREGSAAVECGMVTADRPKGSLLQIHGITLVIHTNR
jgi:hypothetical protein